MKHIENGLLLVNTSIGIANIESLLGIIILTIQLSIIIGRLINSAIQHHKGVITTKQLIENTKESINQIKQLAPNKEVKNESDKQQK